MAHVCVILYIFCLHYEKNHIESGDEKYGISKGWSAWTGKKPPELQFRYKLSFQLHSNFRIASSSLD